MLSYLLENYENIPDSGTILNHVLVDSIAESVLAYGEKFENDLNNYVDMLLTDNVDESFESMLSEKIAPFMEHNVLIYENIVLTEANMHKDISRQTFRSNRRSNSKANTTPDYSSIIKASRNLDAAHKATDADWAAQVKKSAAYKKKAANPKSILRYMRDTINQGKLKFNTAKTNLANSKVGKFIGNFASAIKSGISKAGESIGTKFNNLGKAFRAGMAASLNKRRNARDQVVPPKPLALPQDTGAIAL